MSRKLSQVSLSEARPQTVGQASGLPVARTSGPAKNVTCLQPVLKSKDSSWRLAVTAAALGLTLPGVPLWAATPESPAAHLQAPSVVFSLIRMIGALALVFALLLGGVWVFRNWQRLSIQRGRTPKLKVLEVKSLGPRHALYVVGFEQLRFLVSSTPAGINLLTALPSLAAEETRGPQAGPVAPSFAETLARILEPKNGGR